MKKLYVIDLDGTTLQSFTKMHPKVIEGVKHVKSLGHEVVIATGRNYCSAVRFYDELGLDSPIITANGSCITNPRDNNFDDIVTTLSSDDVVKISRGDVRQLTRSLYYYKKDSIVMDEHNTYIDEMIFAMGCKSRVEKLDNQQDVLAVAIMIDQDKVSSLKDVLLKDNPKYSLKTWGMVTDYEFLEINPSGVNKWAAILKILKYLDISETNVYTFGDEVNDLEMIEGCVNSVAVHNANDVVKNAASQVLDLSNEQGAVGEFLLLEK